MYSRPEFEQKVLSEQQLLNCLSSLPRPLVFTNGCFDVLHRGHVTCLAQAAALGSTLLVAVNSDASVKRQGKGDDRPINGLLDRMMVLAALQSVDFVVPFDADTPLALIERCQPDVLVKGGDWQTDQIVGADLVLQRGGQVHSIPFEHQRSTTSLIDRIRNYDN